MFKIKLRPNGKCFCQSNLKYKKCCAHKPPINDITDNIIIKGHLNHDEYLDGRAVLSKDTDTFLGNYTAALYNNTVSDPLLQQLHLIHKENAPHPIILGLLFNTYTVKNNTASANLFLQELTTQFPTYVTGLRMQKMQLLEQNKLDEAHRLFGKYNKIQELALHRTIFHASELFSFHEGLVIFHLHNNTAEGVVRHYNNLHYLATSFGFDFTLELYQLKQKIDNFFQEDFTKFLSNKYQQNMGIIAHNETQ